MCCIKRADIEFIEMIMNIALHYLQIRRNQDRKRQKKNICPVNDINKIYRN